MRLPIDILAFALVATGAPGLAQSPAMRAELATAQDGSREVVVDGRLWSCTGNACTTPGNDARPAVACRKLARKVGPVTRFATSQSELNAAGLATCNQDRK